MLCTDLSSRFSSKYIGDSPAAPAAVRIFPFAAKKGYGRGYQPSSPGASSRTKRLTKPYLW